jgi:hypothetical protein
MSMGKGDRSNREIASVGRKRLGVDQLINLERNSLSLCLSLKRMNVYPRKKESGSARDVGK